MRPDVFSDADRDAGRFFSAATHHDAGRAEAAGPAKAPLPAIAAYRTWRMRRAYADALGGITQSCERVAAAAAAARGMEMRKDLPLEGKTFLSSTPTRARGGGGGGIARNIERRRRARPHACDTSAMASRRRRQLERLFCRGGPWERLSNIVASIRARQKFCRRVRKVSCFVL